MVDHRHDQNRGRKFSNKRGQVCTVLTTLPLRDAGDKLHLVEFEQTGTQKVCRETHLYRGEFKDNYAPSVYGVGYLGDATSQREQGGTKRLYHMWKRILGICFHATHRDYGRHGLQGETVCDAWLCFATFEHDVQSMKEFDAQGGLRLMEGESVWSETTCFWKTKQK